MKHFAPLHDALASKRSAAGRTEGLSVVSVCKTLGRRRVLKETSLEVAPGEVVALFGPDGAGKTVCFYTIIGLLKPDSGRIMLGDRDITLLPTYQRARLGLGYLPQEPSIFRGLTVEENILAALEVHEAEPEKARRRLQDLLTDLRLDYVRDRLATKLSGGERRRCEIARALASEPIIMLLDEPFAGLDPMSVEDIKKAILDFRKRNIGVLITDYDIRDVLEVVDRVYVLNDGNIFFEGDPGDMLDDTEVRRLFLGNDFVS